MNIIPKPLKYEKLGGEFTLSSRTKLFSEPVFQAQAECFAGMVEKAYGFRTEFVENIFDAQIIFAFNDKCFPEEYHLMISEGVVTVSASDPAGCFYAVETLRQLFLSNNGNVTYHNCYIEDSPEFSYRGLSVDICRHFFPLETLKQIVDLMSRVKLNKLHLHLSDDQGFRIEIDKYPLLVGVGSVRGGSETLERGVRSVDDVPVSGYLTKAQARELVVFAAERNVEVIPELDIPGHTGAILAAYPELSCEGTPLEVRKRWGVSKEILCAGNDKVYQFVKDVLDELCDIFPSKYVHLGGDEAPKDRWCNCKKCREKLAELKLENFDLLQTYFVEQFRDYLEAKGKTVICWNDGLTKDASNEIISQAWKLRCSAKKQINSGRRTILSPFFRMYFDYPYAMTPLLKTYRFNPLNGVAKDSIQNVLGVEGTIWTEFISTEEKLYFNLLPRMLALAEVAWGTNTGDFSARATTYTQLYDSLGLCYNKNAITDSRRHLGIVKKFFKYDPDVEVSNQKDEFRKKEPEKGETII